LYSRIFTSGEAVFPAICDQGGGSMTKEPYMVPELKLENLEPEQALLCGGGSGDDDAGFCPVCRHWHRRFRWCGYWHWWGRCGCHHGW